MTKEELEKFLDEPSFVSPRFRYEQELFDLFKDIREKMKPLTDLIDEAGYNCALITKDDGKWSIDLCKRSHEK